MNGSLDTGACANSRENQGCSVEKTNENPTEKFDLEAQKGPQDGIIPLEERGKIRRAPGLGQSGEPELRRNAPPITDITMYAQ